MNRLKVWPWLRPFLFIILAISIPPVVYWFGYVQSSVLTAKRQAFTTLSSVTEDFRSRLEAHEAIASTAEAYRSNLPFLKNYMKSLFALKATPTIGSGRAEPHLRVDGAAGRVTLSVGADSANQDCHGLPQCVAQVPLALDNLIAKSAVEAEFDGVLLLSARNELLAQDRRLPQQSPGVVVPLRLHGTPFDIDRTLPAAAADAKGDHPGPSGGAELANSMFDFRDDVTLDIAGVSYVAFVQVVSVSVTYAGEMAGEQPAGRHDANDELLRPRIIVCGLIAQDRLRREAIQLAPQTLIAVGALVAFGLFAIPFLKLRFIGENERMSRRDVWLLAGSMLCTTALLVLVTLDGHAVIKLTRRLDGGLQRFAEGVAAHLKEEGDLAYAEMRNSVPALLKQPSGNQDAGTLRCDPQPTPQAKPIGSILAQRDFTIYPDFEALIVTDLCGIQIRKWMVRTFATPNIKVADESYFAPALGSGSVQHPALADAALPGAPITPPRLTFGATVAPTTGLLLGVYAMPVDGNSGRFGPEVDSSERTGIVALATQMRSLTAPVTARPFQFVLVDRRGEVTFRTLQGSFRGERFFEAIDGGDSLARAGRFGDPNPQSYHYRGKRYRMMAVDIPDLQMTLVACYETSMIGELVARVFSTAALFAFGIILSLLLGAAVAAGISNRPSFDWVWPAPSRTRWYGAGVLVCGVAMVVPVAARSVMSSRELWWFLLVAPFAVVVLLEALGTPHPLRDQVSTAMAKLGRRRPPAGDAGPQSVAWMAFLHTSFGVAALLAFVAVPTAIAFNDAFDLHGAAYASETHKMWVEAQSKWIDAMKGTWVNAGGNLPDTDCARNKGDLRCYLPERIYASKANVSSLFRVRNGLSQYPQCANLTTTRSRCHANDEPATPFSFTVSAARVIATLGHDGEGLTRSLLDIEQHQAGAVRPSFRAEFEWSHWAALGVLVLLCALWLLVRSVAQHVLGIRVTAGNLLDERGAVVPQDGTSWLLLRPSRRAVAALGAPHQRLDLRHAELPSALRRPARGDRLILEHLEVRLSDQEWRRAIVELLDGATEGCLILTSEIDPLYFLTYTLHNKAGEPGLPRGADPGPRAAIDESWRELRGELATWAIALRRVRKIREAVAGFPRHLPGEPHAALHEKLAAECGSAEELIEIGVRLLRRPDIDTYRWDAIIGFVLDAAEPYYRSLWELCSRDERLVLIQLAKAGLVNPKREDVALRLGRRGLIILEPRYRLMNRSFQQFVATAEPDHRVADWERMGATFSWARLGTPLYALAAMVIAVLLYAEQGLFANMLAIATGSAATLGSLRSIYASMTKTSPAAGKPA